MKENAEAGGPYLIQEQLISQIPAIQFIDAVPNGIMMVNENGAIVLCNAQIEKLFGYIRNELYGKKLEILIPEKYRKGHAGLRANYLLKPETRQMGAGRDLTGLRKDGTEFPIEIGLSSVETGGKRYAMATIVDISFRKISEEKLREAISVRDEFFSIASHELKTPITALKLNLEITKHQLDPNSKLKFSPEVLQKLNKSLSEQVDRITHLVEDLLDVSKIQAGKLLLNFAEVNLSGLVTEICGRFSYQLNQAKCKTTIELGENVVGFWDAWRLEQVIINLLTNAMKYAPGSAIQITTSKEGQMAKLIVQDFGPGVPKEKLERIFERFERATSSRNISGLGLGLFIVREIVKAHGGSVHLESELGKGAAFVVEIPLKPLASEVRQS